VVRKNNRASWTNADEERLQALVGKGSRLRDVARDLQRSEAAVHVRARRLGLHMESLRTLGHCPLRISFGHRRRTAK
jgi:hypothetical protein